MADHPVPRPVSEYKRGGLELNTGAVFRLLILMLVSSLLGRYFGGMWNVLRVAMIAYPVFSLLYLALVTAGLRYVQDVSTDHPVKGGSVQYTLSMSNESIVPMTGIQARLYLGREDEGVRPLTPVLLPRRTVRTERTIVCPFRGTYPVGLSRLAVTDPSGCLTILLSVAHRVFYVTPRVLTVRPDIFMLSRERSGSEQVQSGAGEDVTLFRELTEYRPGEDAKRILWRYMASRNALLLPRYDRGVDSGLRVILDTRVTAGDAQPLGVEDCSLEIVIAIARAGLSAGIPISLAGFGFQPVICTPDKPEQLHAFVEDSIGLFFRSKASPVHYESRPDGLSASPVVYVTHHRDDALLERIMDAPPGSCGLILNVSGMERSAGNSLKRFAEGMRYDRKLCFALRSADELLEVS
ncbi:MAG: DUF58 domain-containing protein [Spirochaetaceae bacterium]|nr:MAG: DUF58 domain-containing protein [Spirochaetaceae bacterium]